MVGRNLGTKLGEMQIHRTDGDSQSQIQQGQREPGHAIEQQAAFAFINRRRRQLALRLTLIHPVVRSVQKNTAEQERPERRGGIVADARRPFDGAQPLRREGRQHGTHPAQILHGKHDAQHEPGDQHQHLDDVGIHHGFHAAQGVVNDGGDAHEQNGEADGFVQADGKHQRGGVHRHARTQAAAQQKYGAEQDAHRRTEAQLEIFIHGHQIEAAEKRDQHGDDEDHGQRHAKFVLQPGEAAAGFQRDVGGDGNEADGRRLRGHGGDGHRQPGQLPPADVVIRGIGLSAAPSPAQADQYGNVHENDGPVNRAHGSPLFCFCATPEKEGFPRHGTKTGGGAPAPSQLQFKAVVSHFDAVRLQMAAQVVIAEVAVADVGGKDALRPNALADVDKL